MVSTGICKTSEKFPSLVIGIVTFCDLYRPDEQFGMTENYRQNEKKMNYFFFQYENVVVLPASVFQCIALQCLIPIVNMRKSAFINFSVMQRVKHVIICFSWFFPEYK